MNTLIEKIPGEIVSWKECVAAIDKDAAAGSPKLMVKKGERQVYVILRDYWTYNDFNPDECRKLIDILGKCKKRHSPIDDEFGTFLRICATYYTNYKDAFVAFQKALGGKQPRLQNQQSLSNRQVTDEVVPSFKKNSELNIVVPYGHRRYDLKEGCGVWVGEPQEEAFNGEGKYYDTQGDWYEGVFVDGYLRRGTRYFAFSNAIFTGEIKDYLFDSNGQPIYKNGIKLREEEGTIEYHNGDRYEGKCFMNKPLGRGKMNYTNGGSYEGTFDYRRGGFSMEGLDGEGVYTYADGTREYCKWIDGVYEKTGIDFFSFESGKDIILKLWDYTIYWPWAIYAVYVVLSVFSGLWSVVNTIVSGAVVAVIGSVVIYFLKDKIDIIPRWLKKVIIIIVAIWILSFIVNAIWPSDSDGKDEVKTEQTAP